MKPAGSANTEILHGLKAINAPAKYKVFAVIHNFSILAG